MRTGRRLWLAAAAGWLAVAADRAPADPPKVAGAAPRTAHRFAEAADLAKDKRWAEAVELYLRLVDEAGDDLVPSDADSDLLLPARGLVYRRIAARPELLAPYRARVEPRAKRLLEQAEIARDPQLLEQLVDQFFCSRSAEAALHLLGDLACERGDFEQARAYWHQLEPAVAAAELAYPDAQYKALAKAKQILARLLAGERGDAVAELAAFRKAHADAVGHLAGRDGNLAETLQALVKTAESVRVPQLTSITPAPTTFAGDAARNGILTGVLPPFVPQPRYPTIQLPGTKNHKASAFRPTAIPYFPVIARGHVFVADSGQVLAYVLATGQLAGRFEFKSDEPLPANEKQPTPLGYTLTVDGDNVFARLGSPAPRPARDARPSVLVCLRWQPEQASPNDQLRPRWTLPAAKLDSEAAAWDGAPVIRDGRLFAAITRIDGGRAVTAIVCYPIADPSAGPVWQKDVYESPVDSADGTRPHLLTLAGPLVVICSHTGAIVALDAGTGRRAWAVRYPARESPETAAGPRDPAPCIYAAGRLYVAPADAGGVFCLDAASGAPLWQSPALDVAHLLGVASGRVVCSVGGFHAGLCALDAATGQRLSSWGYRVGGAEALAPLGRGLLFGDRVYWPTRAAGVQELRWDGTTGYPPTVFRDLPGGNLAYGNGCLVVATADRLHVLVGEPEELAGPEHHVGRFAPDDDADRRHSKLLWRAERLRRMGRPAAEVRAVFEAAASAKFSPERRIMAVLRWAEYARINECSDEASAVFRRVADSDELSHVCLRDADGAFRSASENDDARLGERAALAPGPADTGEGFARTFGDREVDAPRSPRLRFPLEQSWRIVLDHDHEWAMVPDRESASDRVLVAGRHWLSRRAVPAGTERWRRDLPFTPVWAAVIHGTFIVAGDNGIARLSAADGRLIWSFRVPDAAPWFDRPCWRDPRPVAEVKQLSGFRSADARVIARFGERTMIAVDGATGALLWQQSAPLGRAFHPDYFADGRCVVMQATDARRYVYDAGTGRVLHSGPAPPDPWPGRPIALDDQRLLVVEDGRLVALDRSTWEPIWTWALPRWPSLTGEPPQTRLVNGVLLVSVARNDGYEIERLDPETGRPLSDGVFVSRDRIDLRGVAADGNLLFVATDGELRTIDFQQDRVIARRKLATTGRLYVEPVADGLLLWTMPAASPTEPPVRAGSLVFVNRSEPERQRADFSSLALGLGPGNCLRDVRIVGDQVLVTSAGEIRGYRGAKREVK
jgi:outer membrane protein assembly factor BamB